MTWEEVLMKARCQIPPGEVVLGKLDAWVRMYVQFNVMPPDEVLVLHTTGAVELKWKCGDWVRLA